MQKSLVIAGFQQFSWLILAGFWHLYYSDLVQLESIPVVQQFLLSFLTVAIYTLLFLRSYSIDFKVNLVVQWRRKLIQLTSLCNWHFTLSTNTRCSKVSLLNPRLHPFAPVPVCEQPSCLHFSYCTGCNQDHPTPPTGTPKLLGWCRVV